MRKVTSLFACCLIAVGAGSAQTLSPLVRGFVKVDAPVVVLTHVRVIDGTGAPAREDQTIVSSKGRSSQFLIPRRRMCLRMRRCSTFTVTA